MEKESLLAEVNGIFCAVLDNDDLKIDLTTKADDVDEWDSLSHIQLIVEIEKHFKIKFTIAEIREWKNVGEMIDCIIRRKSA